MQERLETSKYFLVDSGVENGRQKVFNVAMDSLKPHFFFEKLYLVFDSLKSVAMFKRVFDFVVKNVEDGCCHYYYAHAKNTLMERSKLVATKDD